MIYGMWLARLFFSAFVFWLCGLVVFVLYVRSLSVPDISVQTDGIVVFTGDAGRISAALQIFYEQKQKPLLHFSGFVDRLHRIDHAHISYDEAINTLDNIQQTNSWLSENSIQSVRLITSDYHMPRCLCLAKQFWPSSIVILCHPLHQKKHVDFRKWFLEYNKYLLCWIRVSTYQALDHFSKVPQHDDPIAAACPSVPPKLFLDPSYGRPLGLDLPCHPLLCLRSGAKGSSIRKPRPTLVSDLVSRRQSA